MTPHTGFLLAAVLSLAFTLPAMVWQWRARQSHRALAATLYIGGYLVIGAAFVIDPILQPPLFIHGFVPGIGTGMIAVALALGAPHRCPAPDMRPRAGARATGRDGAET